MSEQIHGSQLAKASRSRRALLAGALGGVAAAVAGALGRADSTRAANGDPIVIGSSNTATIATTLTSTEPNGAAAFRAVASGSFTAGIRGESLGGRGIRGLSQTGTGAEGVSTNSYGVQGASTSFIGVRGYTAAGDYAAVVGDAGGDSTGVIGSSGGAAAAKPKTGVYGHADQDASSRGVWGHSGMGFGVEGQASSGSGLYGRAWPSGYALRTHGRIKAEQISGVATIAAGATGVTVDPGVKIGSGSFVLLTPRSRLYGRDMWFVTHPSSDTFRIRVSSARSSMTEVAWLLLG